MGVVWTGLRGCKLGSEKIVRGWRWLGSGEPGQSKTPIMHDGTTTALDLNLNFSGSAATIDATSYINITGVIKVIWVNMIDA